MEVNDAGPADNAALGASSPDKILMKLATFVLGHLTIATSTAAVAVAHIFSIISCVTEKQADNLNREVYSEVTNYKS
jgi:hypothetical protein